MLLPVGVHPTSTWDLAVRIIITSSLSHTTGVEHHRSHKQISILTLQLLADLIWGMHNESQAEKTLVHEGVLCTPLCAARQHMLPEGPKFQPTFWRVMCIRSS